MTVSEKLNQRIENNKLQKELIIRAIERYTATSMTSDYDLAIMITVALETKFRIIHKKEEVKPTKRFFDQSLQYKKGV